MCTQFRLTTDFDELLRSLPALLASRLAAEFLRAGKSVLTAGDVRPGDVVPAFAPGRDGTRAAFPMKWGFRMPGGPLLVNARTESADRKPTFADSWARRRCAIPAAWYYEWEHVLSPSGRRVPGRKYRLHPPASPMLWLCGLYRMEDGLPAFAILTREAPSGLAHMHDRMPLILPPDLLDDWLRPSTRPEDLLPRALTQMAVAPAA